MSDILADPGAKPVQSLRRAPVATKAGSAAVVALLVSLAVPVIVPLGPINLSAYKVVLLLLFFPALFGWLSGRAGKIRFADIMVLMFCFWVILSYVILHKSTRIIEPLGVLTMETFGAYLVARVYIRTAEDFEHFARWLVRVVAVLGFFAIFESLTSVNPLSRALDTVFDVVRADVMEPRMGLFRAASSFDHPIIYGVFCSMAFSLAVFVLGYRGDGVKRSRLWSGMVGAAVFLSLSMGAWLSVLIQTAFSIWDYVLRKVAARWWILFIGFASVYIFLELASNRGPMKLFFSYLSFSPQAAYIRIDIWNYGIENVLRRPLFGLGMQGHLWDRPGWLPRSIDNMWLVLMVRHGLVGMFFLAMAYLAVVISLIRLNVQNPRIMAYRKAGIFTILAISVATATVHLWDAPFVLFNFFFGALVWMFDFRESETDTATQTGKAKRRSSSGRRMKPQKRGVPNEELPLRRQGLSSGSRMPKGGPPT